MIKSVLFLFALILSISSNAQQDSLSKQPFEIGEQLKFYSEELNQNRTINIYLPLSYSRDSLKSYPVIYLLDGSADEDFIHICGLVQFGSFSWINLLPETIVVGIANIDRKHDFTMPTANTEQKEGFPTTGGSKQFIQFLENELQPLIKEQYRTSGTKTIIGQSLGGLLATEILLTKPDMYDNYIIISPSLWWNNQSLLDNSLPSFGANKSIYIGVGKEGKVMENDAKKLYKKLGKSKSIVHFNYFKDKDHGDVLHLAAYDAFEKMFKIEK